MTINKYDFVGKKISDVKSKFSAFNMNSCSLISTHTIVDMDVYHDQNVCESALRLAGYSVGRNQADAPIGFKHGNYDIQKWRNLSNEDGACLDGVILKQDDLFIAVFFVFP